MNTLWQVKHVEILEENLLIYERKDKVKTCYRK